MKKSFAILFFNLIWLASIAQLDIAERAYVHTSRQTVLCGETLYFSAYNLSDHTGQLTDMSKILYVQLLGKDGVISKQKIALTNGRGNGNFFISSLTPTGYYYLVAQTRWMKNFEDQASIPIIVINPFEEYQVPVEINKEWSISYYSYQDKIIPETENEVVISAEDEFGLRPDFKGRLIDEENEEVTNFNSQAPGYAKFSFTPESAKEYRVILEDNKSNFHFSDGPVIQNHSSYIKITETKTSLLLEVKSASENASLEISTRQNPVNQYDVESPQKLFFSKKELPSGVLFIDLKDGAGNRLVREKFYHSKEKVKTSNSQKTYEKKAPINQTYNLPEGNYSVSVKKVYAHLHEEETYAVRNDLDFLVKNSPFYSQSILASLKEIQSKKIESPNINYLPEHLEEIISGTIKDDINNPVENTDIALTVLGDQPYTVTSKSDKNGAFLFHFESPITDANTIITSLEHFQYNYEFEEKFSDFKLEDYPAFVLSPEAVKEVVDNSVLNQIENVYLNTTDSTFSKQKWGSQFEPFDEKYQLDDYTRFPKTVEYFTEYILGAKVREKKIKISQKYYSPLFNEDPLLLLDGVPVDSEIILNLNPYEIETIGVTTNRFFLGQVVVDGLMYAETYQGNLGGIDPNTLGFVNFNLGLNQSKEYHFPDYSVSNSSRIPDKRTLLFWDPNIKNENESFQVNFFTSDVAGEFEIVLEGFSKTGKPITEIRRFTVE